jgi:hypothetical protein
MRVPLTCPSPLEIVDEPLDTVPSRDLGPRHGFTRGALDGRLSMRRLLTLWCDVACARWASEVTKKRRRSGVTIDVWGWQ